MKIFIRRKNSSANSNHQNTNNVNINLTINVNWTQQNLHGNFIWRRSTTTLGYVWS